MNKNEMVESANDYVRTADVFLIGAYNHMKDVKKILKKNDIHIKLALSLAQVGVECGIRTLDCMIKRFEEVKNELTKKEPTL